MKILYVHNYYGSSAPSGENIVFESEIELLKRYGHEVLTFLRFSDSIISKGVIGTVQGGLSTPWNPWSAAAIRHEVDRFQPDIVHAHNTFPLLSPAIFHTIGHRAARVLTLHNCRLFCAAGFPLRAGKVCTECINRKLALPALWYGCYRKSRLATVPLAFSISLHRWIGTWARHVDAFIALSEFQKSLMVAAGLPSDRLHVKPNFYAGNPQPVPWEQRGKYVVFAGRLSSEKGVEILIRAWLMWGETAPELRILGDGPLRESLQTLASSLPGLRIRFLGQLPAVDAERHIAEAQLLILPSISFEGFPMVIREAFAYGTAVAVSNIEPLQSIVKSGINGVVFEPGNPDSLMRQVRGAMEKPETLVSLAANARVEFETKYTDKANYKILMAIYEQAIAASRRQGL